MAKRVLSIILAISMIMSLCCTVSFAETSTGVVINVGGTTNKVEANKGDTIVIPVSISGNTNGISNYELYLVYDNEYLTPVVSDDTCLDENIGDFSKLAPTDNPNSSYEGSSAVMVAAVASNGKNQKNDGDLFACIFKINDNVTKRATTSVKVVTKILSRLNDVTNAAEDVEHTINDATVVINKDVITPVDITLSDLEVTYNGTPQAPGISLSERVNYTLTYNGKTEMPVNAGSYEVAVNVTEDGFSGSKTETFVIKPAPVSVTAANDYKYVGQADPVEFDYAHEGTLYGQDAFTGKLEREAGETAGTSYAIKQGTLSLGPNYDISFTAGTFEIKSKLDQEVAELYPVATGKRYGELGFRWEFELDAASGCTETSYTSSNKDVATIDAEGNVTITGAGTTTLTFKVKGNEIYNEFVAGREGNFVVGKKDLAIEIENKVEVLGSAAPSLTYKPLAADALAYEDTIEVVLERAAGNEIDTPYTISAKSVVIKNAAGKDVTDSYNIDITEGTYTIIDKLAQSVRVDAVESPKTYGDNDFVFNIIDSETVITGDITVTSSNEDVAAVSYVGDTVTVDVKNAGTTEIRVYRAGDDEYADLDVKQTLVVNPRTLKISANSDLSVKIGRELPSLEGAWTLDEGALVAGDSITGELAYENGASTAEIGATFDILQGTLTAGANYNIEFTNGTLTIIDKTPQTITVADFGTKTYGDTVELVVTGDATSGLSAFTYSVSASETEQVASTVATIDAEGNITILGAGTAYITVTEPGNDEYAAKSVTTPLVVNKAPLSISVAVADKIYGQTLEAPSVSYSGFVNSEDESVLTALPTVSGMPEGKVNAGDYVIAVSGAEAANYDITYSADTLNVSRRWIYIDGVVVFDKEYDGTTTAIVNNSAPVVRLTDETSGIIDGDDVAVAVSRYESAEFADAEVGTDKTVTVNDVQVMFTGGEDVANYFIVVVHPGNFTTTATIYAAGTMTAQDVADQVTPAPVLKEDETLTLPEVPEGYTIRIKTSDNEDVLALDGTITALDTETTVNVTFEIVSDTDATDVGVTGVFAITIPKASKKIVTVSYSGIGSVSGNIGEQQVGTLITITATPASGYKTGNWVVDGVSIGAVGNTYSFTLRDDTVIAVEFVKISGGYRPSSGGSGGGGGSLYTVKFNSNGGSAVLDQKIASGSLAEEPTAPAKDGYIFKGWYKDSAFANKFDFASKIVSSITLYAKWEVDNTKNQIILTIGKKDASVFGESKANDVAPIIENDRTMLPARFVAESLGAKVDWDEATSKVTITKGDIVIEIIIGADKAVVNGEEVALDSPAFLRDSRTYTPIRFISEQLGANVEWVAETESVIITPAAE